MPTPVRIRGKPGNRRQVGAWKKAKTNTIETSIEAPVTKRLSALENLPNELIQNILWESFNLNLTQVSPILARRLNHQGLRRSFIFLAFFEYFFNSRYVGDHGLLILPGKADAFSLSIDEASRTSLKQSILIQPWFSAKLFWSCTWEYVASVVPSPFWDHLPLQFKQARHSCSILQQTPSEELPRWFTDLLHLQAEDRPPTSELDHKVKDQFDHEIQFGDADNAYPCRYYGAGCFEVAMSLFMSDIPDHLQRLVWTVREPNVALHIFQVGVRQPSHRLLDFVPQLFNPAIWTMEDLALLLILTDYDYIPGKSLTPDFVDAAKNGLMSAISQKFFPAVFHFRYQQGSRQPRLTPDCGRLMMNLHTQICNDAKAQQELGDSSISTKWIESTSFAYNPPPNRRCVRTQWGGVYDNLGIVVDHFVASEHLIKAMEMMCEPDANFDSYNIFRSVSMSFIIGNKEEKLGFPSDELQRIHEMSLKAGTDKASKCYRYFKDALYGLWYLEGTDILEHGSWFSP